MSQPHLTYKQRPIDAVAGIFNMTGIQAVLQSTSEGDILTGYFPCDEVPTVGFSFPSQKNVSLATNDSSSPISNNSTIFNIPANSWAAANNGNNNCTAVLSGQNYVEGLWVLGQGKFGPLCFLPERVLILSSFLSRIIY